MKLAISLYKHVFIKHNYAFEVILMHKNDKY